MLFSLDIIILYLLLQIKARLLSKAIKGITFAAKLNVYTKTLVKALNRFKDKKLVTCYMFSADVTIGKYVN